MDAKERDSIFTEYGYVFLEEVSMNYGCWFKSYDTTDYGAYLFAKTISTIHGDSHQFFYLISAESLKDAWRLEDEHGIHLYWNTEEELRCILKCVG